MLSDKPVHDWTSHASDGYRYLAVAWTEDKLHPKVEKPKGITFDNLLEQVKKRATAD